jgi:hypothetical protein
MPKLTLPKDTITLTHIYHIYMSSCTLYIQKKISTHFLMLLFPKELVKKDLFKKKNLSFDFLYAIAYTLSPYTLLPRGRGRGSLAVPAAPAAGRGRFHSSGPGGGHTAHRGGHSGTPGGGPGGAAGVTVRVHLSIKFFVFR